MSFEGQLCPLGIEFNGCPLQSDSDRIDPLGYPVHLRNTSVSLV